MQNSSEPSKEKFNEFKAGAFQNLDSTYLSPEEYYEKYGYCVFRNLIPEAMIDRLVQCYRKDIVPSTYPFFRQNTDSYEPNRFTTHGYVQQSFLDIHDYAKFPEFSEAARDIYTSEAIRSALREATGFDYFNLMQTMMFDANTETAPHQDWWYLDSVPNGFLLASWIALEDIDERAGRFYVIPKSFSVDLHSDTPDLRHTDWLARMAKYVDEHQDDIVAPALKKGDVLFWNSRTIHGALNTIDPSFSRKSLTAHYLPSHMKFGNLFVTKESVDYKTYNGMKFFRNQPDYSAMNKLKFQVKNSVYDSPVLMKGLRKIQKLL
jgi:phytanoyl-CoA hydroxylase